eukprot:COSAG05_NODE_5347_length_1200_cov_2.182561_1_plen_208_part_00
MRGTLHLCVYCRCCFPHPTARRRHLLLALLPYTAFATAAATALVPCHLLPHHLHLAHYRLHSLLLPLSAVRPLVVATRPCASVTHCCCGCSCGCCRHCRLLSHHLRLTRCHLHPPPPSPSSPLPRCRRRRPSSPCCCRFRRPCPHVWLGVSCPRCSDPGCGARGRALTLPGACWCVPPGKMSPRLHCGPLGGGGRPRAPHGRPGVYH